MARRKKNSALKQLGYVCAALVALEVGYLVFYPHPEPVSIKDAIQAQLDRQSSLDEKRKEQLRIQLSISDYQAKEGKLPDNLQALVPVYFDDVPKVPGSSEPFDYHKVDTKYYVDEKSAIAAIKSTGSTAAKSKSGKVVLTTNDEAAPLPPEVQQALIASLKDEGALQLVATVYDPTGKRDPFRPFDFAPVTPIDESKSPLERYDVNQLKLTAVITSADGSPAATVENQAGKGFIVKKGMKMGLNSGEVVEIKPDRIIVIETSFDFTGQKKTKNIELRLRTKDQEDLRLGKSFQ